MRGGLVAGRNIAEACTSPLRARRLALEGVQRKLLNLLLHGGVNASLILLILLHQAILDLAYHGCNLCS